MGYTYDKLGRVTSKTDGQGYRLDYAYDSLGRVTAITSSAGQKKTYTYDVLGNVTSVTDANGNTTSYEYTLSGRLKAVTDALGRTILKTDRDGYRTGYDYTADGKVKHISYDDGTSVEMEYTALRQLSAVKDWLGETKIERDAAGAPTEITDHKGRTIAYEWGSMGERRSITYPDGNKAIYEYDEILRLKKMQIEKSTEDGAYLSGIGRTSGRFEEINYKFQILMMGKG